jgi:hypothetical protein
MPKGPQGQKRPADVIGAAVLVGRIATGEAEDKKRDPGTEANRKGGLKGGNASLHASIRRLNRPHHIGSRLPHPSIFQWAHRNIAPKFPSVSGAVRTYHHGGRRLPPDC